jgi:ubiquinone biosynthesis monooxygenase Coq7
MRHFSPLDRLLSFIDEGLKTITNQSANARRAGLPNPAADTPPSPLSAGETTHVAGLMRVNHAGEIAAQGLYHGQGLVAASPDLRAQLAAAAREEGDHLAWCAERLTELQAKPSLLNPVWYAGSVLMGVAIGAFGDAQSLGFVVETERQVEQHLTDHLARLPRHDQRSRVLLETMRGDEIRHGQHALDAGATPLPETFRRAMGLVSKVMTTTAYRL